MRVNPPVVVWVKNDPGTILTVEKKNLNPGLTYVDLAQTGNPKVLFPILKNNYLILKHVLPGTGSSWSNPKKVI